MANGVQLFITFVMISMLIPTGNYLHAIQVLSLLYLPCNPRVTGQCLRVCKRKYKNTVNGTCKDIPPPPPGKRFLKMACECEYMAVEYSRKL
ncbi:unnamed protein product [Brassica rapa]|uniref:Uncharacterized protein n=2 Tax=Brassica TaxID=3705 RepID=A0A8D9LSS5_BRACM|nr:unnamed protein product [Brassica napus]CAG7885431.1 unnamed protein product [Brassica rapa]